MAQGHLSQPYGRTIVEPVAVAAIRRMSWGAALAGAVVALSLQLLLSLLGLGIGLATVDPAAGDTPGAASFGIATGIYYAIVTLVSLFAGGWVAGHLAGMPRRIDGLLHGVVTWSVATLLLLYVVTTAVGAVLSGALGIVSTTLQAAGQSAQAAAGAVAQSDIGGEALNALEQQARQLLGQAQEATGAQDTSDLLEQVLAVARGGVSDQERQRIIDQLVQQTGITREEAEARLQQLESQYQEALAAAEQQAQQAAQATAETVSQGSFWSFVALLLGAVAAALGGWMGAPREPAAASVR
jgi:polyhydroxyalkanoate synthesis regulator phasin